MFKTSMAISPTPTPFAPLLFAGDWRRGLATAIELEFDGVEVSIRDPHDQVVEDLKGAIQSSGLVVSTVATGQSYYSDGLSPTSFDPNIQSKLLDRMKAIIDFAAPWKAPVIIGGVRGKLEGNPIEQKAQISRVLESIRMYTEYAEASSVSLAIEPINRYETNFINTISEALEIINQVGSENLGIISDTFHMNIEEVSLAESLRMAGPWLKGVHFVDNNRKAAGQGHIDFHELTAVLSEISYQGFIIAEILPLPDSRTAAKQAIAFFRSL
ncbi:MAG: sugar phosphate isomerase/epimerase [Anaerolineaceae bacterium]|nr:MAG: sugar phosphate isomerase/epimerase [Anaerolineaceae bacterium]